MNFRQRLKMLRGSLSQTEAAKRAGISQQMWGKLETGKTEPYESAAVGKIARAFGLSTEELLVGVMSGVAEPGTLYGTAATAPMDISAQEQMIETAQRIWDHALRSNRRLAGVIAKIIIIVASSGLLPGAEPPPP